MMKKLLLVLSLATACVASFAANYKFPGWRCDNPEIYKNAASLADNPNTAALCTILALMEERSIQSFPAFCNLVDEVAESCEPEEREMLKDYWKKVIPLNKQIFFQDVWNFCQESPSSIDLQFIMYHGKKLRLSDTDIYNGINRCLLTYDYPAPIVKTAVEKMVNAAVLADVTSQKEDLQKLNRKFSIRLAVDRNAWEPIIVAIRTAVETF